MNKLDKLCTQHPRRITLSKSGSIDTGRFHTDDGYEIVQHSNRLAIHNVLHHHLCAAFPEFCRQPPRSERRRVSRRHHAAGVNTTTQIAKPRRCLLINTVAHDRFANVTVQGIDVVLLNVDWQLFQQHKRMQTNSAGRAGQLFKARFQQRKLALGFVNLSDLFDQLECLISNR